MLGTKILSVMKVIKNIPLFMMDYFGLVHGDVLYAINGKAAKVMVARGGSPDCKELVAVLSGQEYNLGTVPRMARPVIFDVGAHIGSFSLFMFEHFMPATPRVYIFEPDKDNFAYLQRNLKINAIDPAQYVLFNGAVGTYEGTGKLDKSGQNDAYRLLPSAERDFEPCSVMTLADAVQRNAVARVDILKLDIEGGEFDLLQHVPTLACLRSHVVFLVLEYHPKAGYGPAFVKERLQEDFDVIDARNDVLILKNKHLGSF